MKINTKARAGFTLTEAIVALVILSILSAIMARFLFEYIGKVKEETYILEAQGVFRSIEMYTIEKYQGSEINKVELFEQLTASAVTSPENPLNEYLTVTCTKNARIVGLNIRQSTNMLMQLEYQVDGYLVTVTRDGNPIIKKEYSF